MAARCRQFDIGDGRQQTLSVADAPSKIQMLVGCICRAPRRRSSPCRQTINRSSEVIVSVFYGDHRSARRLVPATPSPPLPQKRFLSLSHHAIVCRISTIRPSVQPACPSMVRDDGRPFSLLPSFSMVAGSGCDRPFSVCDRQLPRALLFVSFSLSLTCSEASRSMIGSFTLSFSANYRQLVIFPRGLLLNSFAN